MSSTEQQLTELLEQQAAAVTPPPALLGSVLGRSRQRRRRRRATGLLAATVVMAALGAGLTVLPGDGPKVGLEAATGPIELAKAPAVTGTFPYTASYLPTGTEAHGGVSLFLAKEKDPSNGPTRRESWSAVDRPGQQWLSLEVAGAPPTVTPVSPGTTTVRGHAATTDDYGAVSQASQAPIDQSVLSWEESPGEYLTVEYDGAHITLDEAKQFAEGLSLRPDTRTPWVTMTTAFADAELLVWGQNGVILSSTLSSDAPVSLSVDGCRHGTFLPTQGMKPTVIHGRTYLAAASTDSPAFLVNKQVGGTDLVVDFHGAAWTQDQIGTVLEGLDWTGPVPAAPSLPNTC